VILKPNFKELAALKDFGEKNKLEIRLDYDLAPPWDGTHHREGLALDQKEKDSINDYLNKKYCFKEQYNQDTGKTDLFEPINCGTGMKQCYISPAGEVRPCIDIHRPCGRLGAGSNFQDLWRESKELNEIRNLIASTNGSDKPLCKILKSNKDNSNF
jgi:MoaA/NifB/PqqE/SkfB family radical SAM enzyme